MADATIALDEPAVTDKLLDSSSLTVGANTVYRERINIADPTSATGLAAVTAANGLAVDVTRVSGSVTVAQATATNLKVDASSVAVPVTDNGGTLSIDDGAGSITIDGSLTAVTSITNVVHVDDNAGSLTVDGTVGVSGTVTVDSELTTADLDTGAGTDTRAVVGVVVAASGGAVNLSGNSGTKDNGTVRVVLATDQPQLTNKLLVTPDANSAVNVAQLAGTTTDTNSGVKSAGTLRVVIATDQPQLTNALKVDGSAVTQPVSGTLTVNEAAATSGGVTPSWNSIKATATSVKGSAGQVYGWYIYNSNSSAVYVQFFNTASGSVTLGTTTPVYSLGIPATSAANAFIPAGIVHSTAITIAATTTATGSTNPTNNVDINVFYK